MQNLFVCVLLSILLAACQAETTPSTSDAGTSSEVEVTEAPTGFAALPAGDAERGAEIFKETLSGQPACVTCHVLDGDNAGVGPNLLGYADIAGERVEGESAEEYTYRAITLPAVFLTPGYSNLMPGRYDSLEDQDLADIIAYLLTLTEAGEA